MTRSLVIVVVVYMMCQIPNPCRTIFYALTDDLGCGSVYYIFHSFSLVFALFNSSINFVILVLCGKRFRARVKAQLCFWKVKVMPHIENSESLAMKTNTTHNMESTA